MNNTRTSFEFILFFSCLFLNIFILLLLLKNENNIEYDKFFQDEFRIHNYFPNGTKIFKNIVLNKSETLFYVDYWRSHWCPYYNDRDIFLSHRINELLHLARSRGYKILHLHWKGHEKKIDEPLRSKFRNIENQNMPEIIEKTWVDNSKGNSKYIPGFQDKCIYPNFSNFHKIRCQKPNPAISFGENDIIAYNFKSVASIANYLKIKTVILTGVHTNLCIRSVAMYLALVNISVGYIDDLLDAGFYYPTQKIHLKSHSEMNRVSLKFSETFHGWGIHNFDIMKTLLKQKSIITEPKWIMYPEQSEFFRRFYKRF